MCKGRHKARQLDLHLPEETRHKTPRATHNGLHFTLASDATFDRDMPMWMRSFHCGRCLNVDDGGSQLMLAHD